MKTTILNLVLLAGLTLGGRTTAHEQQSAAARHVRDLDSLASDLMNEYRNALREYHRGHQICASEARLLDALGELDESASHLKRDFDRCAEPCHLREELSNVKKSFNCVEHAAREADAPRCVTRLMSRFEESLECLEHTGFGRVEVERPHYSEERTRPVYESERPHYDEEHCRPVSPLEGLPSLLFQLHRTLHR